MQQTDIKTISLIRTALWDKAQWTTIGFSFDAADKSPPVLWLIFRDPVAAEAIFKGWLDEVGPDNKDALLKLTILRGVKRAKPFAYRVLIGSNPEAASFQGNKLVAFINRTNTVDAPDGGKLAAFLQSYERLGSFFLVHGVIEEQSSAPRPVFTNSIRMKVLTVRDAWTVGLDDVDRMGIQPDDAPIIPEDVENVPVLQLLDWMKMRANR